MAKTRGFPLGLGFLLALFILAQSIPSTSRDTRTYAEVVKQSDSSTCSRPSGRGVRVIGSCKVTRRRVVIDGANVGYGGENKFHMSRLLTAVRYFTYKDFQVTVVLPGARTDLNLTELKKIRYAKLVLSSKCDDKTILDQAAEQDAAIVSRDQYRDWCDIKDSWDDAIDHRRIGFQFVGDLFIPEPQDKRKLYRRHP